MNTTNLHTPESQSKRVESLKKNTVMKYGACLMEIYTMTMKSENKKGFVVPGLSTWGNERKLSVNFLSVAASAGLVSIESCDNNGRIMLNKKRGPYLVRWNKKTPPQFEHAVLLVDMQSTLVRESKAKPDSERRQYTKKKKGAPESNGQNSNQTDFKAILDNSPAPARVNTPEPEKVPPIAPESQIEPPATPPAPEYLTKEQFDRFKSSVFVSFDVIIRNLATISDQISSTRRDSLDNIQPSLNFIRSRMLQMTDDISFLKTQLS